MWLTTCLYWCWIIGFLLWDGILGIRRSREIQNAKYKCKDVNIKYEYYLNGVDFLTIGYNVHEQKLKARNQRNGTVDKWLV